MSLKIKYAYRFFIELMKENPVKTITLLLTMIFFYFAGTVPDYTEKIKIERVVKVDTGWIYLHSKITENKIKYELIYSEVPLKIENDYYSYQAYHGLNVGLWILFVIGLFIVISATFTDGGWEFSDVQEAALASLVVCEIEDEDYLYFIDDRLIGKRKHQIQKRRYLTGELGLRTWSDLMLRPIYKSKQKKRQNALEKLGII